MTILLIIISMLISSGIRAQSTNDVNTSVQGLTFWRPVGISVTNYTETGEFKMEVIHIGYTNTFNAGIYIFTNAASESTARKVFSILERANSGNATCNNIVRTILGSKQNGTLFISKFPDTKLSSELFLLNKSGTWILLNMVYAAPDDDAFIDQLIESMKYSKSK